MKLDKYHLIFIGAIVALIVLLSRSCQDRKYTEKEQLNLIAALQDSVHHFKDKDSINTARIAVIETEKVSTFLKLKSIDSSVIALQDLVQSYKKQLSHGGSATNVGTVTHIDTTITPTIVLTDTVRKDSFVYIYPTYLDTIKDKWMVYTSESKRLSHSFKLTLHNDYSIVIGTEKGKVFADIKTYNPHTIVDNVRTYQVSRPPPKNWGIGPAVGYGWGTNAKQTIFVGVVISYHLVKF